MYVMNESVERMILAFFFFFNDTATAGIYTLSLHDALPISRCCASGRPAFTAGTSGRRGRKCRDRKSTRLNSSHVKISYAVFCLKKKKPVGDVPVRQGHRGAQALLGVAHLVELLVALPHPAQDVERLVLRRRMQADRLEAAHQGPVLLDVAVIVLRRGGADALHLAA